jgi:hypothetical protein
MFPFPLSRPVWVLLPSTAWCIPHLGLSCPNHNGNRIGAIAHNTNSGNSSSNSHNNRSNSCNNSSSSSSSTVLLLHCRSSLESGHHSRLPPVAFCATIAKRWDNLSVTASCPSKATHHELRHPWSINKGPTEGSCSMDRPCQLHHHG